MPGSGEVSDVGDSSESEVVFATESHHSEKADSIKRESSTPRPRLATRSTVHAH